MIVLQLRGEVPPGGMPALRRFLTEAIPFYESIEGVRVRLLAGVEDGCRFIEEIAYRDEEAFRRDQERVDSDPQMREYLRRWHGLLAAGPVVETYRVELPEPVDEEAPGGGEASPG